MLELAEKYWAEKGDRLGEAGDGDDEGLHSLSVLPCLLLEFKPHPLKEQFLFPSSLHPISDFYLPLSFHFSSSDFFFNIVFVPNWIVISMASRDVFPLLIFFLCVCSGNVHVLKHQTTLKAISLLMTFRAAKSNLANESENLSPNLLLFLSICIYTCIYLLPSPTFDCTHDLTVVFDLRFSFVPACVLR